MSYASFSSAVLPISPDPPSVPSRPSIETLRERIRSHLHRIATESNASRLVSNSSDESSSSTSSDLVVAFEDAYRTSVTRVLDRFSFAKDRTFRLPTRSEIGEIASWACIERGIVPEPDAIRWLILWIETHVPGRSDSFASELEADLTPSSSSA